MTGGASRVDVQSLVILQPLSVFACGVALMSLRREHLRGRYWVLGGFSAMFALAALHLVLLPPDLLQSLPGRRELADIDNLVGRGEIWRPLTLSATNNWHALAPFFAPFAVLLFGIQLSRDDLYRLLPLLISVCALSAFLGLLQVIGGSGGPLYLYRITNNGSAVGLFANRNHAALLLACLFPMLAVFASTSAGLAGEKNSQKLIAAAMAIVLVPLILVTGSRSGLVLSVLGVIAAALLYRRPPAKRQRGGNARMKSGSVALLGGFAVLCLAFLTFFLSRAAALDRLFEQSIAEDSRSSFWTAAFDLFWKYFPFGSGFGSFAEAYRLTEPSHSLNMNYVNHAHNDWLETAATFGAPGLLLLAAVGVFYLRQTFLLWRREDGKRRSIAMARLAGIAVAMIAVASLSDYPLRTPTMMCVFALLTLWFVQAKQKASTDLSDHASLRRIS